MREDHGRRVDLKRHLHDFPRVDRRPVDGAAKQLGILDQAVLRIQEQTREHLVVEPCQHGTKELLDDGQWRERGATLDLLVDHLARSPQDLVGRSRQVTPLVVTYQQRRI
jgi:hypothetical protein